MEELDHPKGAWSTATDPLLREEPVEVAEASVMDASRTLPWSGGPGISEMTLPRRCSKH